MHAQTLTCVQLFATPWTVTSQAPLSVRFFKQEYWSELPFPPPGDFPDPGIKPASPAWAGEFFNPEPPGKPAIHIHVSILPQTPLSSRLPHSIEQSSMCCTVGPCWLSVLNIAVCTFPFQTAYLSLPPHPSPRQP